MEDVRKEKSENFIYPYVYIDDDENELIRWKKAAEEKNIKILLLKTYKEFFWQWRSNYLSKNDTAIYIDCYLALDGIRGEQFAMALHREGYKRVFLASAYHADKLKGIPWFIFSEQRGCPLLDESERGLLKEDVWYYDAVYIDNDDYLREYWEKVARNKNIKLITMRAPFKFERYARNISKVHTSIYLDCDLGEGVMRGDEFAKILHSEGYQNLYMVTNYDASFFSHLPWLKYAGKNCPFDNSNELRLGANFNIKT